MSQQKFARSSESTVCGRDNKSYLVQVVSSPVNAIKIAGPEYDVSMVLSFAEKPFVLS